MGTGTNHQFTQKTLSSKPPRCSICRKVITDDCDWQQGRCPHQPSMAKLIVNDNYKARFYNLLNFFKGRK